jgi:prepilin-type N-terminal cleavage/methylation domain-containing protein
MKSGRNVGIKSKGFTLVELLVVIFIISILAGLVIVNLTKVRMKSRDARRKADVYDVANALEMYYSQKHSFPGNSDFEYKLTDSGLSGFTTDFLPRPPYDPLCKNSSSCSFDYIYKKTSTGKYCIYAKIENTSDKDIRTDSSACGTPTGYNYFIEK